MAFEPRGARLRLVVVSPSGERFVKRGDSTLTIDVPDAVAGSWTYIATPEVLPYPNFPFTMTVGAVSVADVREKAIATTPTSGPRSAAVVNTGSVRFREIELASRRKAQALRIAVTTSQFDDMGKLLRSLGDGYRYDTVSVDDLVDSAWLDRFDILFLTCDAWPGRWHAPGGDAGKFEREGVDYGTYREDLFEHLYDNIRRFVSNGGTLYASDFRYTVVAAAFPSSVYVPSELLRELNELEKEWLGKISKISPIETVTQSIQQAILSRTLADRVGQVVASLEGCLIDDATNPSKAEIVKSLRMGGVSPFDPDVHEIGRVLQTRAGKMANALSGYRSSSTQAAIRTLRKRLQGLRDRVAAVCVGSGEAQVVTARVVDPGLQELLGDTVALNFNTRGWDAARFAGKNVNILMRGEFRLLNGGRAEAPLLVKFPAGQGSVIFTSFHNEAQNSRQEEALLRYLVFSAVTAKEQSLSERTMLSGGFSPAKRSLISHSSGQPSVTRTYQTAKGGPIRFALSFAGQEARLKLQLVAPTGQVYEKEVSSTLVAEGDGAPAGVWHYTITSLQVPHENLPFSVTVWQGVDSGNRR